MQEYLPIAQIIVSILLIISILIQQRGTAMGGAFGGGGESSGFYSTRRGLQQKILWATVILGILFISLAFIDLVL
ncbi:preprotein translocase subunit SecG [Candidatus Parcubacteria bacterium]|nr:preprotein translocase subunit SecG [Candidatus Parcubacteria bacterium]